MCYHQFNTSESQLSADGIFFGFSCPQNIPGFLKFEEICYLEQCNDFINTVLSTHSKSLIECSQLVVLWLSEAQLDPWLVYLIFGRKYVYLSNENLTVFIGWVVEQRNAFDTSGIDYLESKFKEYLVRAENKTTLSPSNLLPESISTPFPLPQTLNKTCVMETEGNRISFLYI